MPEQYSLVRAITETLAGGVPPSRTEREFHFVAERALSQVRPLAALRTSSGGKYQSFLAPLSTLLRDLSVTGDPTSGSALVGMKTYGRSDLASWSRVIEAGALVAAGLKDRVTFWQVSSLPTPVWGPEYGMNVLPTTDSTFTGFLVQPKRLAAVEIVSRQLLIQSVGLEEMLSRQLGSLVDQICLLGSGPTNNQPTGLAATPGVNQIVFTGGTPTYADFAHAERLCGESNVSLDSYAVITSPAGKEVLQTTPVIAGFPVFIWDKLKNPASSMEVSDNRVYMGAFHMLTIAVWGGLEIVLNPFSHMGSNQIELVAYLWVDIAVRLPTAFAVSDPITPLP
jgi:hypothetical protein